MTNTYRLLLSVMALTLLLAIPCSVLAGDQRTFATPQEAAKALQNAAQTENQAEMLAIFGDEGKELVYSGDPVQDENGMKGFVKAYNTKHSFSKQDDKTVFLVIGTNDWPMPIPLVNEGGKWHFDTASGKQELLYRRIGHNELGAIATARGYIAAQADYASKGHDGLPAGVFAQKLMSTPGKQDGLYWETKEGEATSPAGPMLAEADAKGYDATSVGRAAPYHGYLFRILTAQGPNAKGGSRNYVVDGKLSGGVALIAYPAEYRTSGVMTFIINQDGVVYQRDLGEKTAESAKAITEYNPDATWKKVPANE